MRRSQLEHVIRAAGHIADDTEIIIIGSQAVLGQFPDAPDELLVSNEVDVFPAHHPERADLIDGSIGELSPFHESFGYFAQGVDETTATLPEGWRDRLILVKNQNTSGITGCCLEIHDLLVSKYAANREKDILFNAAALRHGLADAETLLTRLDRTDLDADARSRIRTQIAQALSES